MVAAIVVVGLVPSLTILTLILTTTQVPTGLVVLQIILFIFSVITSVFLGVMAEVFLDQAPVKQAPVKA